MAASFDSEFQDLLVNTVNLQRQILARQIGRNGANPTGIDIDQECRYPDLNSLQPEDYRDMYDRFGVAARVVGILPDEMWEVNPQIYEVEGEDTETDFELALKELNKSLDDDSQFADEETSPIWEALHRLDVMAGIGRFGVLLLGTSIGSSLEEPIPGFEDDRQVAQYVYNAKKDSKLLYLRVFDESLVKVSHYEDNRFSRRYGQPIQYQITFNDPNIQHGGTGHNSGLTAYVHWSRVIHLTDNVLSNEVYGMPRMQNVYPHLLDLRKLYGGSAEMYWQGAFPGLSFETHPQLGNAISFDANAMREQVASYFDGLQRYLALTGATAKPLSPTVADPSNQIKAQLEAICIKLAVPMRLFMGSERGELASSQDAEVWKKRMQRRRVRYANPRIIKPFFDRLIRLRVLPTPKEWHSSWDASEAPKPEEQAELASKRMTAVSTYIQSGADVLIPPLDFLVKELGYDREEAEQMLEDAEELTQEAEEAEEDAAAQTPPAQSGQTAPPAPPVPPTAKQPPTQPSPQQTANADTTDGVWRTAEDGAKIFITKGGEVRAGGPEGKVLGKEGKGQTTKPSKLEVKQTVSSIRQYLTSFDDSAERAVLVDSEGNFIGEEIGEEGEEMVNTPNDPRLEKPGAGLVQHHNHPIDTPPSLSDVLHLASKPGMGSMFAHSAEATYEITPTTDDRDKLYHAAREAYSNAQRKWTDWVIDNPPAPSERAAVKLKTMQESSKDALESLSKQGLIKYTRIEKDKVTANAELTNNNCGVGPSGFQPGNTCAKGGGSVPFPKNLEGLKVISGLGGSTGAKLVQDSLGNKFVMKTGASPGHIRSEYNADKLYEQMGVKVPAVQLYESPDGPTKLSQYFEDAKPLSEFDLNDPKVRGEVVGALQKDFALDAVLGNWDVIGAGMDNVLVREEGGKLVPYRIDNGGALSYRAQGASKGDAWNGMNKELETMRNNPKNPGAMAVYGSMTAQQVSESEFFVRERFGKLVADDEIVPTVLSDLSADDKEILTQRFKAGQAYALQLGLTEDGSAFLGYAGMAKLASSSGEASQVAGDHATGQGPDPNVGTGTQATSHTNMSPSSVLNHIAEHGKNTAMAKPLYQDKLAFLNPAGVQNGKYFVPLIGKGESDPKHLENIEVLKKVLPPGTEIQGVWVKKSKDTGEFNPQTKAAQAHVASGKKALEQFGNPEFAKTGSVGAGFKSATIPPAGPSSKPSITAAELDQMTGTKTLQVGTINNDGIEDGAKIHLSEHDDNMPSNAERQHYLNSIPPDEKEAIGSWKGSARGFRQRISKGAGHITEKDVALLKGIKRAPSYAGIVHRGVHGDFAEEQAALINNLGIGGLWTETSTPMCTSRNPEVAHQFAEGQLYMKIKMKDGALIQDLMGYNNEKEVVGKVSEVYRLQRIVNNAVINGKKVGTYVELEQE